MGLFMSVGLAFATIISIGFPTFLYYSSQSHRAVDCQCYRYVFLPHLACLLCQAEVTRHYWDLIWRTWLIRLGPN